MDDGWGKDFEVEATPRVIRAGQLMTMAATDGTDAYGHSWTWGPAPPGAKRVSCKGREL